MGKGKTRFAYEPDYAVPPGVTLQETIAALGMDQHDLATRMGMSEKTISQIVNGAAPVTYETANKLELVTGVPARLWNNLEMNYRQRQAELESARRLEQDWKWLDRIPTEELVARGKIDAHKDKGDMLRAVLRFFGVSSVMAWQALWLKPATAFRRSRCFEMRPEAMATWLRLGELEAQKIACKPYSKATFRAALDEIRKMTMEQPQVFQPKMVKLCADAGVAIVFVPEMKGCPANGAARWLTPWKAIIQLSLRHKSDDHLWFSFFHEAGHILDDPKKEIYIDDGSKEDDEREKQADTFARNLLIPPSRAGELPDLKTSSAVRRFSQSIGIAPGIVVGRLQHDRVIAFSHLNELKKRFEWGE